MKKSNPPQFPSGFRMISFLFVIFIFPIFLSGCQDKNYAKVPQDVAEIQLQNLNQEDQTEQVKRGAYLVTTIGCGDCHSPKKFGERGPEEIADLRLSGFPQDRKLPSFDRKTVEAGWMLMNEDFTAAVGGWGVSFAANLTSDETGIGNWSFEQFKNAMRKGKYKGMKNGRDLLPPMPWPNFAHLNDDDLKAMFAYLKSTQPVENVVPAPIPPNKMSILKTE